MITPERRAAIQQRPLFMAPHASQIERCVKGHRDQRHFQSGKKWTCSACGKRDVWSDTWGYHGSIECKKCWRAAIDWVACSDACRDLMMLRAALAPDAEGS